MADHDPHRSGAGSSPGSGGGGGRREVPVRLVVLLVLAVLILLLGLDNRQDVPVGYLVDESEIPLVWVILVSVVGGAVFERAWVFVRGRASRKDRD